MLKLEFPFLEHSQSWRVSQLLRRIEPDADTALTPFTPLFLKYEIVHVLFILLYAVDFLKMYLLKALIKVKWNLASV